MPRLLATALATVLFAAPLTADPPKPKVKLAVLVVFDQMRGDYVEKWQPLFGEGGFKRLQADGVWFPDCHYPYGTTTTGPGHASILSGCSADTHGIVNNTWYDRAAGKEVYCAASDRYELVPPMPKPVPDPKTGKMPDPRTAGNPDCFLSETVGDVLKRETNGAGKVFGLSLKDRSALLPVGKRPNGAYWFAGKFVTSTYYRDALPAWVTAFNQCGKAESYFGHDWTRFRPDLDYAKYSGPDDAPGEGKGKGQGTTFPHPTTGGKDKIGSEYYEAVTFSPAGNDLLLAFAKACVVNEKLGQDDVPDLLTVSFSSNDLIGHVWGPDSQEVLDVTLRSDALMADFLAFLDGHVGKGNYAVVVTADHGICPTVEAAKAKGLDARRVPTKPMADTAERFLRVTYGNPGGAGPDRWIEAVLLPHFYLNHRLVKARGLEPEAVAAKLAEWLRTEDGVERVFTRAELLAAPALDPVAEMTRRSYHPDRGGDVVLVPKPYYLPTGPLDTGTTHGTPHPYDTHAVFLAYGPGIGGGKKAEKVTPLHAAAILADQLGVKPPKDVRYGLPATLAGP